MGLVSWDLLNIKLTFARRKEARPISNQFKSMADIASKAHIHCKVRLLAISDAINASSSRDNVKLYTRKLSSRVKI